MIGVEFNSKPGFASALTKECANNGMLLLTTSIFETIRVIPPLNVSEQEIETGLQILETSLKNVLVKSN